MFEDEIEDILKEGEDKTFKSILLKMVKRKPSERSSSMDLLKELGIKVGKKRDIKAKQKAEEEKKSTVL